LGSLEGGAHELTVRPAKPDQVVNLDYWYLCEGRFKPDSSPAP
jgi:hypothetical protein